MKLTIVALFLFAGVACTLAFKGRTDGSWKAFKLKHKKEFQNETHEEERYKSFVRSKELINEVNKNSKTVVLGETHLSDLTDEEKRQMNGLKVIDFERIRDKRDLTLTKIYAGPASTKFGEFSADAKATVPDSFDWTTKGFNTVVRDQGQCGCCWSVAAAGALEGYIFATQNKSVTLAAQELKDCTSNSTYGNAGCNGGVPVYALAYVKKTQKLAAEADYKLNAKTSTCGSGGKIGTSSVPIVNFVTVAANENSLKQALTRFGPVTVSVNANDVWMNYKSGIIMSSQCTTSINHAVLLVGYGTDTKTNTKYWKIKNSWSSSWGEGGYVRIERDASKNTCGIYTQNAVPIKEKITNI